MSKLTLRDLSLKGQTVLMRADFNVPLSKEGRILDDSRIRAALPSIHYILDQGAKLILMSHLGKPLAKPDGTVDSALSLRPVAKRLSELLGQTVPLAPDCIGPQVESLVSQLKIGQVLLLENLRFHSGEEKPDKDPAFAASLAHLADVYVNDAFGTAHRAHASTAVIAKYFPGKAAAGFLMEKEISQLSSLLQNPKRPFYALIGGAKISTKIGVIQNLLPRVDSLFLGGGMIYTLMKSQGIAIGKSICEDTELHTAENIARSPKIHLPLDLVIAKELKQGAATQIIPYAQGIPPDWQGVDIGPKTATAWATQLQKCATCFWNGPLGIAEIATFASGTAALAKSLAACKQATTVVGGGDSVAVIEQMGLADRFTHLSTGGGASLEFLESGHLPGIDSLTNKTPHFL